MNFVGYRPWVAALIVTGIGLVSTSQSSASPVGANGGGNVPLGDCSASLDIERDAVACRGYVVGNDDVIDVTAMISAANWSGFDGAALIRFKDNRVADGAGSDTSLFDVLRDADDESRGHLRLLTGIDGPFVLTLKGGNEWAGYYYATGAVAGTTFTFDIPGKAGAGLSHASIYTPESSASPLNPAGLQIPEPSGYAALLPGLLAIGLTARRRRRG